MDGFVLKLYVTGQTPRSQRAVANLRRLCDERLPGQCLVSVVDVLEQPEAAEADRVLATPTLVRVSPPPVRRVIGDLTDIDKVVASLDLHPSWQVPGPSTTV